MSIQPYFAAGVYKPPPAIGAISDLAVSSTTSSSALLSFTAAANATSHDVQYSLSGANSWSAASTLLGNTVSGLSPSTAYDFQVRGVGLAGNGSWSNTATATTAAGAAPDTPYTPPSSPNVSTATTTVSASGTDYIDGLLNGSRWQSSPTANQSPLVITFSFPSNGSFYTDLFGSSANYGAHENTTGFSQCNSTQQTAIREILQWYGRVINVVFVEVTESSSTHGVIRYANSSVPSTSYAYYPSGDPSAGDIWFGTSVTQNQSPVKGTYGYAVTIHETGHALGLKHPHDTQNTGAMSTTIDALQNTVMSYRTYIGNASLSWGGVETYGFPTTPMAFDVAALQYMYGANYHYSDGDTTYTWDATTGQFKINGTAFGAAPGANRVFMCLWDGGGSDTLDASNYASPTIDLTPGAWSTLATGQLSSLAAGHNPPGNISLAYRYGASTNSDIENHTP